MRGSLLPPVLGAVCAGLGVFALAAEPEGVAVLALEPQGTQTARLGYMPIQVPLSKEKPAGVKKEPAYRTAPSYATIKLGDGPNALYLIAVDEPKDADFKIYLDVNRNGDLTDDGDGAWSAKRDTNGRVMFGLNRYVLAPSWKNAGGDAKYGLAFYRFTNQAYLLMYREGARTGTITLDGKPHKVLLVENDADALYAKPLADGAPASGRPVWLLVDLNDDGKFAPTGDQAEQFDARRPFRVAGKAYEAQIATDGSRLKLVPTTREVAAAPVRPERPALLAAASPAPDFTVEKWGGGELKLSDYRGKVVILDFWAPWCGPCRVSMPHLEKVHKAVKGQDVVVLAVCVWDEKVNYVKWVPENSAQYTFQFAFDPAGKDNAKSVASNLFKVSGIPTTYIIDKEGKVAEAVVGFSQGDVRVETALRKLGVKIENQ